METKVQETIRDMKEEKKTEKEINEYLTLKGLANFANHKSIASVWRRMTPEARGQVNSRKTAHNRSRINSGRLLRTAAMVMRRVEQIEMFSRERTRSIWLTGKEQFYDGRVL
jgi:hypothetical protein